MTLPSRRTNEQPDGTIAATGAAEGAGTATGEAEGGGAAEAEGAGGRMGTIGTGLCSHEASTIEQPGAPRSSSAIVSISVLLCGPLGIVPPVTDRGSLLAHHEGSAS